MVLGIRRRLIESAALLGAFATTSALSSATPATTSTGHSASSGNDAAAASQDAAPSALYDVLLRKTQDFSDAGLKGDKAALDAALAPDVAFTNEDGSTPSKAEILQGAVPPPPGVEKSIKVIDFKVRAAGPVAVATFVDVLDQAVRGEHVVHISRTDGGIASSVNGAAPVVMKAELKDVFFIPGQTHLRRIFERGPDGRIIGYIKRFDGQDLHAKRT